MAHSGAARMSRSPVRRFAGARFRQVPRRRARSGRTRADAAARRAAGDRAGRGRRAGRHHRRGLRHRRRLRPDRAAAHSGLSRQGRPAAAGRRRLRRRPPDRRQVRGDPGRLQELRHRHAGAGPRLGRAHRRQAPGRVEPGGQCLARHAAAAHRRRGQALTGAGRGVPADHDLPADHRDAPSHGRGAGLAQEGDRLVRPGRAGHRSRGLEEVRPPRVGRVPAGQDQPQPVHLGPARHRRRLLRGHRNHLRPHGGRHHRRGQPQVRLRHRKSDRPLRAHHADVPEQPAAGRRPRPGDVLYLGRDGRGELRLELQPGQSRS